MQKCIGTFLDPKIKGYEEEANEREVQSDDAKDYLNRLWFILPAAFAAALCCLGAPFLGMKLTQSMNVRAPKQPHAFSVTGRLLQQHAEVMIAHAQMQRRAGSGSPSTCRQSMQANARSWHASREPADIAERTSQPVDTKKRLSRAQTAHCSLKEPNCTLVATEAEVCGVGTSSSKEKAHWKIEQAVPSSSHEKRKALKKAHSTAQLLSARTTTNSVQDRRMQFIEHSRRQGSRTSFKI